MKSSTLVVASALVVIFALALGVVLMQQDALSAAADGSVNQSPLLYISLFLGILAMGAIFSKIYNDHSPDTQFSFRAFMNVAVAAILIGGVVHEMTHVALLQHPAQFRVHFGDSNAVFSTCCLAPGEFPHEEIAYAIQFLATLAWILLFRGIFLTHRNGALSIFSSKLNRKGKSRVMNVRAEKHSKGRASKHVDSTEEELDHEWQAQKELVNHYLNPHTKKTEHVKEKNQLDNEMKRLNALKFKR